MSAADVTSQRTLAEWLADRLPQGGKAVRLNDTFIGHHIKTRGAAASKQANSRRVCAQWVFIEIVICYDSSDPWRSIMSTRRWEMFRRSSIAVCLSLHWWRRLFDGKWPTNYGIPTEWMGQFGIFSVMMMSKRCSAVSFAYIQRT